MFCDILGSSLMAIIVTCSCGKQFKVKEELAGKRGKCVACGRALSVPTLAASADQEKATPSSRRACPTCQETLQPNAVICLNCGLDLRTGKQLPHAKSSAGVAPARPSESAPSSRLWIALIAGGTCVVGVAAAVILLSWGWGTGGPTTESQPKSKTKNLTATSSLPGPFTQPLAGADKTSQSEKKVAGSNNPADPLAAKQPVGPGGKTVPDQLVVKKLLGTVAAITPEHVTLYERFLKDRNFLNATVYQGSLSHTGDDVREVMSQGLEKPAVSALIALIQEKKPSADKRDLLICAQAVKALGQFGASAEDAVSQLAGLQNHEDVAVGSAAKLALNAIKSAAPGPLPTVSPTAGPLTFQVKSFKTQNSYDYGYTKEKRISVNNANDTLLVVNISARNGGKAWETFSSSSFRIVDKDGKSVDAHFLGFGNNVTASGSIVMQDWSSLSVDGDTFLKYKGRIDSLDPKNTLVDWELAHSKTYTETFVFVIPAQTQGPRFEMAKK
jgi:hypothetical protein